MIDFASRAYRILLSLQGFPENKVRYARRNGQTFWGPPPEAEVLLLNNCAAHGNGRITIFETKIGHGALLTNLRAFL